MEMMRHVVTIVVGDVDKAFVPVSDLLHEYAKHIHLRVGYPMRDKNVSVIFLIIELDPDDMGAFSGKLGQIKSVKVKTIKLKID
ncbi:MAG: iron-only hydrogenase system regulator [Candidatus Cloacimonetes bacterium HGW-Cloacimonetes-2]|jgi:putative iron-only hydrogenase system regulator|nr:MAG: iron-only hydrogenase system regulator [Candidatus Cloacimonetes bacterium HGW-Cloacimonetes-2]